MARRKRGSLPSYRLHKASRQAVVTINGREGYPRLYSWRVCGYRFARERR